MPPVGRPYPPLRPRRGSYPTFCGCYLITSTRPGGLQAASAVLETPALGHLPKDSLRHSSSWNLDAGYVTPEPYVGPAGLPCIPVPVPHCRPGPLSLRSGHTSGEPFDGARPSPWIEWRRKVAPLGASVWRRVCGFPSPLQAVRAEDLEPGDCRPAHVLRGSQRDRCQRQAVGWGCNAQRYACQATCTLRRRTEMLAAISFACTFLYLRATSFMKISFPRPATF